MKKEIIISIEPVTGLVGTPDEGKVVTKVHVEGLQINEVCVIMSAILNQKIQEWQGATLHLQNQLANTLKKV